MQRKPCSSGKRGNELELRWSPALPPPTLTPPRPLGEHRVGSNDHQNKVIVNTQKFMGRVFAECFNGKEIVATLIDHDRW